MKTSALYLFTDPNESEFEITDKFEPFLFLFAQQAHREQDTWIDDYRVWYCRRLQDRLLNVYGGWAAEGRLWYCEPLKKRLRKPRRVVRRSQPGSDQRHSDTYVQLMQQMLNQGFTEDEATKRIADGYNILPKSLKANYRLGDDARRAASQSRLIKYPRVVSEQERETTARFDPRLTVGAFPMGSARSLLQAVNGIRAAAVMRDIPARD